MKTKLKIIIGAAALVAVIGIAAVGATHAGYRSGHHGGSWGDSRLTSPFASTPDTSTRISFESSLLIGLLLFRSLTLCWFLFSSRLALRWLPFFHFNLID